MYQHIKMGHLNSQDLAKLLRKGGFKISNNIIKEFKCEACLKSKSTSHRPEDKGRIAGDNNKPGSFIHSDIAGPEKAYNEKNYMINFVDDYTGATYVKFMKNKSEVPMAIKEFIKDCKTSVFRLPIDQNTTLFQNYF